MKKWLCLFLLCVSFSVHAEKPIDVELAKEGDFSTLRTIFFEVFGKAFPDISTEMKRVKSKAEALKEAYELEVEKWKNKKTDWYIAQKASQVVGFLIVDPYCDKEKIYFRGIGVATAFQNQGIGTTLVARVCQILRGNYPQAKQFIWYSRKGNDEARAFYKSFGNFRPPKSPDGIYDPNLYDGYECYFPSSY